MNYFSLSKKNGMFVWTLCILAALTVLARPVPALSAENEIVCLQCHANLPEQYSRPVALWRASIHAENGIACNNCHGGDPKDMADAMNPARGFLGVPRQTEIPAFCGRCHVGVLKDYLASAHGRALGKRGPTCVTCHGNHRVVKASLDLINEKSCSSCHRYERAGAIKAAMQATEAMLLATDMRIAAYKQIGADTDRLEKGLFATRNRFHTLFHNVDLTRIKGETAAIRAEIQKIDQALARLDKAGGQRRKAGAAAVGASLLAALLFHLLRKTYR